MPGLLRFLRSKSSRGISILCSENILYNKCCYVKMRSVANWQEDFYSYFDPYVKEASYSRKNKVVPQL